SAALDALFASGAREVTVAEGASDASAGFARFGYHRETCGRPVRFLDLNRHETEWEPLELLGVDGTNRVARISRTITSARCRVSPRRTSRRWCRSASRTGFRASIATTGS